MCTQMEKGTQTLSHMHVYGTVPKSDLCGSFHRTNLDLKSLSQEGFFEGYASTSEVDSYRDVVKPGAFRFTLAEWKKRGKLPFLLWQHEMKHPIGYFLSMEETARGLYVKGALLLNVQQGYEAYVLLKKGVINGLSIGFQPVIARHNSRQNVREIFQVRLVEISVVSIPANQSARVYSVKARAS